MKEIKELEEAQRILGEIQSNDIPTIVGALSAFSYVWSDIGEQSDAVAKYIELGVSKDISLRNTTHHLTRLFR